MIIKEDRFELSETAPEWARRLEKKEKKALFFLLEELAQNIRFGRPMHHYPCVEIDVSDEVAKSLLKKIPHPKKIKEKCMQG